jgi:Rps23 Pro-64 3,4-dihydroxylase Tpa1-like proline 4-hydroxylase
MQSNSQQPDAKEIKVQILLAGGHQHTVYLKSNAPLLHSLLTNIAARAYKQDIDCNYLFQVPINEGHSILCFPSENLIGIITEPPIFVEEVELKPEAEEIIPSFCIQIDNFLTSNEHLKLIEYAINTESNFVPTSTSTNETNYRSSKVLYSFTEFSELIATRIQKVLPDVINKLNIPLFFPSQIEAQMTAHNDGNYYRIHNDNGSPDTHSREVTFVYYFYKEPKAFTGGELLIYDSKIENNFYVNAETFNTVEPRNNSIVFFLSRYLHEVRPVLCLSQAFADSRFTINGWIHRTANLAASSD